MLGKNILMVGVLGALVSGSVGAETIEVYSCNATEIQIGEGADLVCVAMPDWVGQSVEPDDSFDGPADEYSKGGGKKKTKTKPNRPVIAKPSAAVMHKAKCKACKTSADKCMSQVYAAEQSCTSTASGMATHRCEKHSLHGGDTPWGCGTFDLYDGQCPGVEAPWNDKSRWEPGGESTQYNCEESWRLPHPGGSVSSTDETGFSATFKGVGATQSTTINSTYQLTGRQGYQQACSTMGDTLAAGCISAQAKCVSDNACSELDL